MTTIKLRRGTSDQWASANPVLAQGEPGYDLETAVLKVGDGVSTWAELPGYLTGDALSNQFVRADAPQFWSAAQRQQALDNVGAGRIWTPRQFGPTGGTDDTATFQTAVNKLAGSGGTLWCDEPQYNVGGLVLSSNVTLRSLTYRTTFVPPAGFSGWIITTPAAKQRNIGIRDLLIYGNVNDVSAPDVGGVLFQNTAACQVVNVGISQTSLGSFKQVTGQATQLIGCGFQNRYDFRALTQDEGALWLLGTDHLVLGCECNADGYATVQYPDDLFRAAMLLAGSTIWVYGSNGEYADVGIKVTGTENRLIGARGDVNAGPGIVVEGTYNSLTNTLVLANSLGADGRYSHIQLGPGAYGSVLDGVTEGLNFTSVPNLVSCVVDDQVELFGRPDQSDTLPTIRDVVHERQHKFRKVNQKYVSRAIMPASSGNPVGRPPSRYCAGQTFYDTKNNRLTISDGSYWRDASGTIAGSVIPPKVAVLNDPSGDLGWTPGSGTSGVAGVSGWTKFNTARAMEVTADGSGPSCAAQTATPIANVSRGSDVTNPVSYALVAYHLGVTQLATLSFSVVWSDKNGNQVGTTVTTAGDPESTANTAQRYSATGLTPPPAATQVSLTAIFTRTGMGSGEAYRITKFCLVPGADPGGFVEP